MGTLIVMILGVVPAPECSIAGATGCDGPRLLAPAARVTSGDRESPQDN
jgi:hypothetical protein